MQYLGRSYYFNIGSYFTSKILFLKVNDKTYFAGIIFFHGLPIYTSGYGQSSLNSQFQKTLIQNAGVLQYLPHPQVVLPECSGKNLVFLCSWLSLIFYIGPPQDVLPIVKMYEGFSTSKPSWQTIIISCQC